MLRDSRGPPKLMYSKTTLKTSVPSLGAHISPMWFVDTSLKRILHGVSFQNEALAESMRIDNAGDKDTNSPSSTIVGNRYGARAKALILCRMPTTFKQESSFMQDRRSSLFELTVD